MGWATLCLGPVARTQVGVATRGVALLVINLRYLSSHEYFFRLLSRTDFRSGSEGVLREDTIITHLAYSQLQ